MINFIMNMYVSKHLKGELESILGCKLYNVGEFIHIDNNINVKSIDVIYKVFHVLFNARLPFIVVDYNSLIHDWRYTSYFYRFGEKSEIMTTRECASAFSYNKYMCEHGFSDEETESEKHYIVLGSV